MGKIKKAANERHAATVSPAVSEFVTSAVKLPLSKLPRHLRAFPQHWPFPRGDLYHWIPLLDRFDHILELFNKEYGLESGPQQVQFACKLLLQGDAEAGMPYEHLDVTEEKLRTAGYSSEGDKELVEVVLHFTRILLENCGNRSLYASSGHLNNLLHTASLSLLRSCLRLSLRLAQRYQVARYKNQHPHAQAVLLANHYNFNLDRLQKLAAPLPRSTASASPTVGTPAKGKEKVPQDSAMNPSDLASLVKEPLPPKTREELATVSYTYYDPQAAAPQSNSRPLNPLGLPRPDTLQSTPTPMRRTSNLGPGRDRSSAAEPSLGSEDTPGISRQLDTSSTSAKSILIPAAKVASTPTWALVSEYISEVPQEAQYDLLHRIRVASVFASSNPSPADIVELRLLAVTNLAYAYPESKFAEKIGTPDAEEPRRFHLAQQLCDMLQPASNGQAALSQDLEATVLLTAEALLKCKHKAAEVAEALSIRVNHGVLFYELRRVVASLAEEELPDKVAEQHHVEWRDALFDLVHTLVTSNPHARYASDLVSSGIIDILVEVLKLHTARAERTHEKVLNFFDGFIHGLREAFQALANAKGLDVIADLTAYEVESSLQNAQSGNGMPKEFKTKVTDYDIPYYQQATLRNLFKTIVHMYEHNVGAHDRLLRNLIDSPQLLGALRTVIGNANVFGSNVWSAAVNIMSSFIHNEPTSYQVIAEAGLSKGFLEAIMQSPMPQDTSEDGEINETFNVIDPQKPLPSDQDPLTGILPVGETMVDIPTAFGAICLNEGGMKLFQRSGALSKFFEIFVSAPHVRAMEEEGQTANAIGQSFDELARHHPTLKDQILSAILVMIERVKVFADISVEQGAGAKLWLGSGQGSHVAGGQRALHGLKHEQHEAAIAKDTTDYETNDDEPVSNAKLGDNDLEKAFSVQYMSAAFKFLHGFFHNSSMCQTFCGRGGAEEVLDLALTPSLPHDFFSYPVFSTISHVIKTMTEAKPHLVLPSLLRRTQYALHQLKPMINHTGAESYFAGFTNADLSNTIPSEVERNATYTAKSLVQVMTLSHILERTFSPPQYTPSHRSQSNTLFTNVNLTDVYIQLVDDLGKLHAACIWENLTLQSRVPEKWKSQTNPRPFTVRRTNANGIAEVGAEGQLPTQASSVQQGNGGDQQSTEQKDATSFAFKNTKTLRFLLSQTPGGIESFFHMLGNSLLQKRTNDPYWKQSSVSVAEHLAESAIWQLDYRRFTNMSSTMRLKYDRLILSSTTPMLLRHSTENFGRKEALTLILLKYVQLGGFAKLNSRLEDYTLILTNAAAENKSQLDEDVRSAKDGLDSILKFYAHVVQSKCIVEVQQSNALQSRDRGPDYFNASQFLVELRDAALPAVTVLWRSEVVSKTQSDTIKTIIDILRRTLEGEGEERAFKRADNAKRRVAISKKATKPPSEDEVQKLVDAGYSRDLAREALFRCNDNPSMANHYCLLRGNDKSVLPRYPIPEQDNSQPPAQLAVSQGNAVAERAQDPHSHGINDTSTSISRVPSIEMQDAEESEANGEGSSGAIETVTTLPSSDQDMMSDDLDNIPVRLPSTIREQDLLQMAGMLARSSNPSPAPSKVTEEPFVTIDELDEKRQDLRQDLIDRCLGVLSEHPGVTFDLADLISAAVAKSGEGASPRADIGQTLVSALMSLQGEEDGKKIASYAHLVALVLQDNDFFSSTLDELKEYFEALVGWVQVRPDQNIEETPWLGQILLIIERVLAEDERPAQIEWNPPSIDKPLEPLPAPKLPEPLVSAEEKETLFERCLDLFPKIGKDSSLALSVTRVLVILTRNRGLAKRLSEKPCMSRLFLMARQLSGFMDDRLQSAFLVVLRHMVEDEDMIRQIMRTEIKTAFENHRSSRGAMDTTSYTRNLSHLVLRDPELFVEVTKEVLEITRFEDARRPQSLALKKEKEKPAVAPAVEADKGDSTEASTTETKPIEDSSKTTADVKPPTIEVTDGVIQQLLRELSNYKDVEDQYPKTQKDDVAAAAFDNGSSHDVEMTDATPTPPPGTPAPSAPEARKTDKPVFKAEENSIYIYRCFLLQCLVELLASYNRTKLEFISFSRKGEAQPSTPSKPRSGTLNYLLNVLIPVGTLAHGDDMVFRKRSSTSNWAISTIVALCSKTHERAISRRDFGTHFIEEETELVYVRKFVLEHALRAYKDALSSSEPLDQRYARLLSLSDLFNRMLTSKPNTGNNSANMDSLIASQQQLGKLMYEKHFISALTSSIAEIDLNFPSAKRAVKYILRPLKWLTDIAVTLSQTTDMSSSAPGTSEDDEISSATSLSEDEQEREATPDLFRNSTLGLLEPGQDDEASESDSEDEGDEYDEYEMEDEMEGMEGIDEGEVISDDDEEIEGMEGMGEIEGVNGDVEMEIEVVDGSGEEEEESGSESDDDEDDDQAFDEMEEITGDDENASLGEEGDWEDDGVYDGQEDEDGSPHGGPLDHLAHVLGADGNSDVLEQLEDGVVRVDMGDMAQGDDEYFEDEMAPDDDEGEDEDDYEQGELVFEPELEGLIHDLRRISSQLQRLNMPTDDEDPDEAMGWDWDQSQPPARGHAHHHHHHRASPWTMGFTTDEGLRGSPFRTHRNASSTRGNDDGTNPLLRPGGRAPGPSNTLPSSAAIDIRIAGGPGRRAFLPHLPQNLLRDFISVMNPRGEIDIDAASLGLGHAQPIFALGRGGVPEHIGLDPTRPWREQIGLPFASNRAPVHDSFARGATSDEAQAVSFEPTLTTNRWQEEARILFGATYHDKATRIIHSILRELVPQAMEAKRLHDKAEAERRAEEEKRREEERKKAEAEKVEREAQEKKEREEREAREAQEAAERERAQQEQAAQSSGDVGEAGDASMEGVEAERMEIPPVAPEAEPAPAPRITTTIRGREINIAHLGIDLDYLNALPEDLREEVIISQAGERGAQAVAAGQQPDEVPQDFLEALPPEMQQELLRQQASDRRRREREENRRRAAAANGGAAAAAQPEDMNNADFMATLDAGTRQQVLMEVDDAVLAGLPAHIQAEARALIGDRRSPLHHMGRLGRVTGNDRERLVERAAQQVEENNAQRRPVVQMLDKAGVATLLRLMFVSLQGSAKTSMHGILSDVCKNTQNRAEVISILLSILQDGSTDVSAVEKSFAHLSLRAKQLSGPKTPQPLKRSLTGQLVPTTTEISPLSIVQQCLATLNSLTVDNPRVPSFFLSEHETSITSQKAKAAKKGKGREIRAAKFPLNALLTLLDRKLITENAGVMETLASLLKSVTQPLTILLKRAKEAGKEAEKSIESAQTSLTEPATESTSTDVDMAEAGQPDQPEAAATADSTDTGEKPAGTEDKASEKKKHRDLVPPEIPEENIRLVVNILAARECNNKTFRDTLDVIKNLSAIPGAKDVLGRELVRQAQELGQTVLSDLEQLATQINAAKTGTDLQGMALANFSSGGSKQEKLLRVLLALDHIFDPKRASAQDKPSAQADILATLYESSTFEKLWDNLSACLTAIRQRGNMINVATILMPLVESFMVVCKNTSAKDGSLGAASQEVSVSTPPPDAGIKNLFFSFTEEHRKILNELVRNNPKLLSGSFSTLVNNSKVLEFDNKRTFFTRKLHQRSPEERLPHSSLQLNVRRDQVFLDSFKSLYYKSGPEVKYGKLSIRFHGEEGVDAGGVTREWFAAMARQMFNPDFALFNPVASDRTTFHPNRLSDVNPEHLMFFKFIGRIIGKALYEGRVLDCHFSRAVYKRILGKSVSLKDMETLDLDYYRSLLWILEHDITDVTFETFSVDVDRFGVVETVDLIENGRNVNVTEENKAEYVRLVVEHRLIKSVEKQLGDFLKGFHEIVPEELIGIFNEQELELLISGLPDIDVDDWKNNTEYHNYTATSPQIQWFWRAVRSFDQEEKAKLLQFVTGTSKVPLNGFKELEGMNGFSKFNIHRDFGNKDRLPSSHTCFNQLDLPEYESYENLRDRVYTAITTGSEYFGFA